jgi:hypothetical protein
VVGIIPTIKYGTTKNKYKSMTGRCVQALRDVLEDNYAGDITRLPYVANKEAFGK